MIRDAAAVPILLGLLGVIASVLLASDRLQGLLFNTAWLAGGTWLVSLPIGTLVAVCVAKTTFPGRHVVQQLFIALLFVPLYVQAVAWQAALGLGGWFVPEGQNWLSEWNGAIWVHGMAATPWVVLFLTAALRNVPRELEEESLQDVSPSRVLWHVTLRRALYALLAAALWVAVLCAGEITVTDYFQIRTFAEEVFTSANLGTLQPVGPTSESTWLAVSDLWIGTLAIVCLVIASLGAIWLWLPTVDFVSSTAGSVWRVTAGRALVAIVVWCLAALTIGVPLVAMVGKAGTQSTRVDGEVVRRWSVTKATQLTLSSPYEHRRELGWTCAIGGTAALCATMGGISLGWMTRSGRLQRVPTTLLLAATFAIPGPLLGLWTIHLLNHPADSWWGWLTWLYDRTIFAPVWVQFCRALPLATLLLSSQLSSVPQDLLDSAKSEGAGWWRRLWLVALPMRWHAVVAAGCMSLVVAVSDLAATVLVVPPGVSTLSIRIAGLLHYGTGDRLSALCLMLAVSLGALASLGWKLVRG